MARIAALLLIAACYCFHATPVVTAQDRVMMQGFYWDVPPDGSWYNTLATRAAALGRAGFDGIWLPPPSKGAAGGFDMGYTPYDYYDLGEFDSAAGDQTSGDGSFVRTRFGTRWQLENAVQTLKSSGLEVYMDLVLNHRSGGSLEPNQYGHWYTWSGGSLYGQNGQTYTAFPLTHGSGRIAWPVGQGNEFFYPNAAVNPDNTFDFYSNAQLAGFHQMYVNDHFGYDKALHDGAGDNLPLGDSMMVWGDWLTTLLDLDGYRFDFVKGIHPEYFKRFMNHGSMNGKLHVHELYDADIGRKQAYLNMIGGTSGQHALFDFNMRFAYKEMSDAGMAYDIRNWNGRGLINNWVPYEQIVTFVDNHDFDRLDYNGEVHASGHAPVVNNKLLAYAHMLTHPGYATVWWRDYYKYGLKDQLDRLIAIRKAFASGTHHILTAFGDPHWPGNASEDPRHLYVMQRTGINDTTGLIVAINKHDTYPIDVWVTSERWDWANRRLYDVTGNVPDTVDVFADRRVLIRANPNSYSVWVPLEYQLPASSEAGIDYVNLQHPPEAEIISGSGISVYARVFVDGWTTEPGVAPGVEGWIGYNSADTDPRTDGSWSWVPAAFNVKAGDRDEYVAELGSGLAPGEYFFASRFRFNGGPFAYGGWSETGGGFWQPGVNESGRLTVLPPTPITTDGVLDEADYMQMAVKQNTNAGFGSAIDVSRILYHPDHENGFLYLGVEGKVNPLSQDGIGIWLGFDELDGRAAGEALGGDPGGHYTNNAPAHNDFRADFETNLMLALNPGSTASELYVDAVRFGSRSAQYLGNPGQGGTAVSGPDESGVFSAGSIRFAFDNSGAAERGFEIRIPYDELGVTPNGRVRAFAFVVSSDGFFSNVTVPGAVSGGNPGYNVDFGGSGGGPYHTAWHPLRPIALSAVVTHFAGVVAGGEVVLKWDAERHPGVRAFEVQTRRAADAWQTAEVVEAGDGTHEHRLAGLAPGRHAFRLQYATAGGHTARTEAVELSIPLAEPLVLEPPYPNPAEGSFTIRFAAAEPQRTRITLIDVLGRELRTLHDAEVAPGELHTETISVAGLSAGMYFLRLQGETGERVERVVVR